MAAAFRVVAGRKSIESGLARQLVEMNHKLENLFISKDLVMKVRPHGSQDSDAKGDADDSGYVDRPSVGV